MSLQPADPGRTPPRRRPFEPWRKLALAGAVVLLIGSVGDAASESWPHVATFVGGGLGWGLLAAGFGRAMVDRRRRARATTAADGSERD